MNNICNGNYETLRALREIILAIVETNLSEFQYIESSSKLVGKLISFPKKNHYSNGISVNISEDQVRILINVHVFMTDDLISNIAEFQSRIYHDVYDITGIAPTTINVRIINLIKIDEATVV